MVYEEAPWIFKGKALYQLQLVKSEEARKYIPEQFRLVEAFGYTLGGFYLARYDDSPAGVFDELVAMAGLVWNPPTSCAWAARVYVNNKEARDHGVGHVGLPSRLATFNLTRTPASSKSASNSSPSWWQQESKTQQQQKAKSDAHSDSNSSSGSSSGDVEVLEVWNAEPSGRGRGLRSVPVVRLELPRVNTATGPRITLTLPSFSGATPEVPSLLRYACDLRTNIGLLPPARAVAPLPPPGSGEEGSTEVLAAVMGGRPLVTLEFAQMEMKVEEPEALLLAEPQAAEAVGGRQWATAGVPSASLTAGPAWAGLRR